MLLVRVLAAGTVGVSRRSPRAFSLRSLPLGLWVALGFGILFLGLLAGALLRGETDCVPWLLLGLLPGAVAAYRLHAARRPPERDEAQVVLLDRLREQTRANYFGSLVPGTGRTGWLTEKGVYLDSGERLSWSSFSGSSVDWIQPWVYRISLPAPAPTRFQRLRASLQSTSLLGLVALGPLIEAATAVSGHAHFGLRNDVLAAEFAFLGLLSAATFAVKELRRDAGKAYPRTFVGLVNGRCISYEEILATLERFLPH